MLDGMYQVYSAQQQNQKEKYEGDLKKEIKKLQRHRSLLLLGATIGLL